MEKVLWAQHQRCTSQYVHQGRSLSAKQRLVFSFVYVTMCVYSHVCVRSCAIERRESCERQREVEEEGAARGGANRPQDSPILQL